MIETEGRLSSFQPIADDDGIDVLIYDKVTGKSAPLQIKARTDTVKKRGSGERGNIVHFELRKASANLDRNSYLLCVLLDRNLRNTERAWLIPFKDVSSVDSERTEKYVICANKQTNTNDKYKSYHCISMKEVGERIIEQL